MVYIDRDKALLELQKFSIDTSNQYGVGYSDCLTAVEDVLNDLPLEDVEQAKHGEWLFFERDTIGMAFNCSICGYVEVTEDFEKSPLDNDCNYCSRCGAKMDGTPQKEG